MFPGSFSRVFSLAWGRPSRGKDPGNEVVQDIHSFSNKVILEVLNPKGYHFCTFLIRGSRRGILVMRDKLILFSVKSEYGI